MDVGINGNVFSKPSPNLLFKGVKVPACPIGLLLCQNVGIFFTWSTVAIVWRTKPEDVMGNMEHLMVFWGFVAIAFGAVNHFFELHHQCPELVKNVV